MFHRVNAFLEAIDKKSEEMADAAEEEQIAHTIQQQQQRQQHLYDRHNLRSSSDAARDRTSSQVSGGNATNTPALLPTSAVSTSSSGRGSALPQRSSSSVHTAGASNIAAAAPYVIGGKPVPLAQPTKLPSFRPTSDVEKREMHAAGEAAGRTGRATTMTSGELPPPPSASFGVEDRSRYAADSVSSPLSSAVERLQARCAALEADKTRWQQEAATYKAQCSSARDALWQAEQEARTCRAAQRDAEHALALYKETSHRLLEEAQQEVKRARDGRDASCQETGSNGATQEEELTEAREVRQRWELLQAEHVSLLAEVERYQHETAKVAAELQVVRESRRLAQTQVDALQLDLQSAHETMAGEVAAHAETKKLLRDAQTRRAQQQALPLPSSTIPSASRSLGAATDAAAAVPSDLAALQAELRDAAHQQRMLTLQLSNKQTLLDAAEREMADMKARYNSLARQVGDAQVEVAAGFHSPAASAIVSGALSSTRCGGSPSDRYAGNFGITGVQLTGHRAGGTSTQEPIGGLNTFNSNANTAEALRRNPVMLRLANTYGPVGRAACSVVCAMDASAVRLGRVLTQAKWVWRVMIVGYIAMLQLWILLLIFVNYGE